MKNIKMNNFKISLALLVFILALSSCRKDDDQIIDTQIENPTPVVNVISSFNGIIKDEDGLAMSEVAVNIGNMTQVTDQNGYYYITTEVNKNGTFIKVTADGYFDSYANVLPSQAGTTYVNFQMLPKGDGQTVSSDMGGKIEYKGHEVSLVANSFVDQDGNKYDGEVTVYTSYIDPTSENFSEVLPGDLAAVNEDNEAVVLTSFGMLHVELYGENGETINIDQNANLSFRVPDEIIAAAPSEIPLWYFDTNTGLWIEEGFATLVGNSYVGEVAHFSLWNCDLQEPIKTLSGVVKIINPVPHAKVCIERTTNGDKRCLRTDDQGMFEGKVPANEDLIITVYDDCDQEVSNSVIPSSLNFVTVQISPANNEEITVIGQITNCDNLAATNAYAIVSIDGGTSGIAHADNLGNFSKTLINCSGGTEVKVKAINVEDLMEGDVSIIPINGNTTVDADIVNACGMALENHLALEFTNGNNLVMPVSGMVTEPDNPNVPSIYEINVIDQQNMSDNVIYTFTFLDWSGAPNSLWAYSYESRVFGDAFTWDFNFTLDENAIQIEPSFVQFNFIGGTASNSSTGETFDIESGYLRAAR